MEVPEVKLIMHLERETYRRTKCCSTVGELTQKYRSDNNPNCHMAALYLINGKPYCKRHAGDALLSMMCNRIHK